MRLIDVIPVTRIPHTQTQILSYFFSSDLAPGSLVLIPLGKRKETGVVLGSRDIDKMQIKKADFSLRNIIKVLDEKPVLTSQQIELALFLGQYYFASPGLFIKMTLPPQYSSSASVSLNKPRDKSLRVNSHREVLDSIPQNAGLRSNNKGPFQKLILAPTIASAKKIAAADKKAALWHSDLTIKQKNEIWRKVKNGQVQTLIGTRSAAFLPFVNLKEIIIEDVKNSGHRSWDMFPHYESLTAAKKLAEIFKANLLNRDALPDELKTKNYELITKIVDMREELKAKNFYVFSFALEDAIKEALAQKKQVILFANRRGAANFILCRDCGHVINCPDCEAPMALHQINGQARLFCHHCGRKDAPPGRCPKCHDLRIKTVGSGTQKIESEAQRFFPDAKIARLDSDLAPKPAQQQKIIDKFKAKEIDILITTQIIFSWLEELAAAKPSVVAILSADTLLHLPDFRSGERTFQTIKALRSLQDNAPRPATAGLPPLNLRGGKGELSKNKSFIIQTYNPDNSAIKYAAQNDWESFWREEDETRQALNYPPYSQIVKLTFRHRDGKRAGQEAKILSAKLQQIIESPSFLKKEEHRYLNAPRPATAGLPPLNLRGGEGELLPIEISPALPAFIPRERGRFVWNIIIKFSIFPLRHGFVEASNFQFSINNEFLQKRNSLLQYVPQNWEVDVDPENLL